MTAAASRAIAGCLALAAFTVAVISGLAGGNTATSILGRAILAMIICYPIGLVIGLVCEHVIQTHVEQKAAEDEAAASAQSAKSAEEVDDVLVV